jgi:hypothetical protein
MGRFRSRLCPPARVADAKLKSIAKVMTDKPGLKLEIAGRVDPATDRRAAAGPAARQGRGPEGEGHGEEGRVGGGRPVTVSPGEYPAPGPGMGREVSKPRNMIGLAKDLPVPRWRS